MDSIGGSRRRFPSIYIEHNGGSWKFTACTSRDSSHSLREMGIRVRGGTEGTDWIIFPYRIHIEREVDGKSIWVKKNGYSLCVRVGEAKSVSADKLENVTESRPEPKKKDNTTLPMVYKPKKAESFTLSKPYK